MSPEEMSEDIPKGRVVENTRRFQAILAASLALGGFFKNASAWSSYVPGFKGWPGDARKKGKAKRKARLRFERQAEVIRIHEYRKAKNNKRFCRMSLSEVHNPKAALA